MEVCNLRIVGEKDHWLALPRHCTENDQSLGTSTFHSTTLLSFSLNQRAWLSFQELWQWPHIIPKLTNRYSFLSNAVLHTECVLRVGYWKRNLGRALNVTGQRRLPLIPRKKGVYERTLCLSHKASSWAQGSTTALPWGLFLSLPASKKCVVAWREVWLTYNARSTESRNSHLVLKQCLKRRMGIVGYLRISRKAILKKVRLSKIIAPPDTLFNWTTLTGSPSLWKFCRFCPFLS